MKPTVLIPTKIHHFRFWCQHVLPLVYDDSLSYMELLCKVVEQLNTVIDGHNQLTDDVAQLTSAVNELEEHVSAVEKIINTFMQTIENRFNQLETDLTNQMNSRLDGFDTRITVLENRQSEFEALVNKMFADLEAELTETINVQLQLLHDYVTDATADMQKWVEDRLEEFIHDLPDLQHVYVYDIFSGKLVSIETALYNLYDYARPGALTAAEWDELGLTAREYDKWLMHYVPTGLTATQYDTEGRFILGRRIIQKLRSPMTGDMVDRRVILAEQDNLNKEVNCWTVEEWENALTADQLDALAWSAFDLDWHSNMIEVEGA